MIGSAGCTLLTTNPTNGIAADDEPLVEEQRLAHRHRLGARDEHEADARLAQQRERLLGALAEAAEDVVELGEEHAEVVDELASRRTSRAA